MQRKASLEVVGERGVAHGVKAVIASAWALRKVGGLDLNLDAVAGLPVLVGNRVEGLVAEVNVRAAIGALVRVAANAALLACVAGIVHWARVGYLHDHTAIFRTAIPAAVVVAGDLEALAAHGGRTRWAS